MFDGNMMNKLMQMQEQAKASKKKLEQITVQGEAGGNLIIVELNGNRKLKNLTINTDLQQIEKEDLEDLISVALERALKQVDQINEQEMAASAKGLIPGL